MAGGAEISANYDPRSVLFRRKRERIMQQSHSEACERAPLHSFEIEVYLRKIQCVYI